MVAFESGFCQVKDISVSPKEDKVPLLSGQGHLLEPAFQAVAQGFTGHASSMGAV